MSLKAFLKENAQKVENIKIVLSRRFKDEEGNPVEWEIKALKNKDIEKLKKEYTKVTWKKGLKMESFDSEAFVLRCATESIAYPNLNDKELQDSYGVMGASELLLEMLTAGEYTDLVDKINDFNGFNKTFEEKVEEAKN